MATLDWSELVRILNEQQKLNKELLEWFKKVEARLSKLEKKPKKKKEKKTK